MLNLLPNTGRSLHARRKFFLRHPLLVAPEFPPIGNAPRRYNRRECNCTSPRLFFPCVTIKLSNRQIDWHPPMAQRPLRTGLWLSLFRCSSFLRTCACNSCFGGAPSTGLAGNSSLSPVFYRSYVWRSWRAGRFIFPFGVLGYCSLVLSHFRPASSSCTIVLDIITNGRRSNGPRSPRFCRTTPMASGTRMNRRSILRLGLAYGNGNESNFRLIENDRSPLLHSISHTILRRTRRNISRG